MAKISDVNAVVGKGELQKMDRLGDLVKRADIKNRFEEMLGKKSSGFLSSLLSLSNSKLVGVEPKSILASAAIAASLDLPINPSLGFAHIIGYSGVAQFQIGWRGLVQLAIRTGLYQTMNAAEVYEGELVKYSRITGLVEIDESKKTSDKIVAYVAYFKLTTGFEKYLLMDIKQIETHAKRYSKAFSSPSSPWKNRFHEMALKTVLKMLLSKYGVLSIEMQQAIKFDQGVVKDLNSNEPEVTYPDNPTNPFVDSEIPGDAQEPA